MHIHTPGPWHSAPKSPRSNNLGVYDRSGNLVASLDVHPAARDEVKMMRGCDADLMAASPSLYAFARRVARLTPNMGVASIAAELDQLVAEARRIVGE